MKYALFFLVLFIASNIVELVTPSLEDETVDADTAYTNFKTTYQKTYTAEEDAIRKPIFTANRKFIIDQNKLYAAGTSTFGLSCNEYTDLTDAEFNAQLKGVLPNRPARVPNPTFVDPKATTLPAIDYKDDPYAAVSKTLTQGKCGANYAFAAIVTLEAQLKLKKKIMVALSEEQIIDCSQAAGNKGCGGGTPQNAFNYLKDIGGVVANANYPLTSNKTGTAAACIHKSEKPALIKVTNYIEIPEGDDYLTAVLQKGPVVAAIDASNKNFRFYSTGIYKEATCKNTINDLDHYVAVTGYKKGKRGSYWICKNSWGNSWGYSGNGRISRDEKNHCGIATDVTYPETSLP